MAEELVTERDGGYGEVELDTTERVTALGKNGGGKGEHGCSSGAGKRSSPRYKSVNPL